MARWQERGNCWGVDPVLFIGTGKQGGVHHKEAKAACQGCPVKAECLDYALVNRIEVGIYGGTSYKERREMMRQLRSA